MRVFCPSITNVLALSCAVLGLATPIITPLKDLGILARGTPSAQCADNPDFLRATLHGTPKRDLESSSLVPRGSKYLWCGTNGSVYIKILITNQIAGIAVPFLLTESYSSVQSTLLRMRHDGPDGLVPSEGFTYLGKKGCTLFAVQYANRGLSWRVLSVALMAVFNSMVTAGFGTATVEIFDGIQNQVGYLVVEPT